MFSKMRLPGMLRRRRHWFKWCRSMVELAYSVANEFLALIWKEFVVPRWSRSWPRQAISSPRHSTWNWHCIVGMQFRSSTGHIFQDNFSFFVSCLPIICFVESLAQWFDNIGILLLFCPMDFVSFQTKKVFVSYLFVSNLFVQNMCTRFNHNHFFIKALSSCPYRGRITRSTD